MDGIIGCAIGRLGQDADLHYSQSGTAMLRFSIAVYDSKRAQDAPTEWLRVTCWKDQATALDGKLLKGSEVYVEGRLKLNTWQKDGVDRSGLELNAWTVQPLGVSRNRPKVASGNTRQLVAGERD